MDTYSLLSFTVQFVSAASAWELMKAMDSVALRAIKAVISYITKSVRLRKDSIPRFSRLTNSIIAPIDAPDSFLYLAIAWLPSKPPSSAAYQWNSTGPFFGV